MLKTDSSPLDFQFSLRIIEQSLHYPHTFVFLGWAQQVSIDKHIGLIIAQYQSCQRVFVDTFHILAKLRLAKFILIQALRLGG